MRSVNWLLEANGKVNGIGEISHPDTIQNLGPIWMPFQMYHYVSQGVDVQNLIKIDSAVAALRMREKTAFGVGFFVNMSIRSWPSSLPASTCP